MALGMVMQLPDAENEHSINRQQLQAKLDVAMGGARPPPPPQRLTGQARCNTPRSVDWECPWGEALPGRIRLLLGLEKCAMQ